MWFLSIFDMIQYFRKTPIPMGSGGPSNIVLINYVVSWRWQWLCRGGQSRFVREMVPVPPRSNGMTASKIGEIER